MTRQEMANGERPAMSQLTLTAACQATGKSKSTLWRAIKSGRVSASRTDGGDYLIDEAELARAFPPETKQHVPAEHHKTADGAAEKAILEAQLAAEKSINVELRERVADLTRQRDKWMEQAEAVRLLAAPLNRPGFWRRMLGR